MNLSEFAWGVIGLLLSVMTLSYLIKDNFLFRLASHIFIGVTAGYLLTLIIHQILWARAVIPLIEGSWLQRAWMVIPLLLVLLLILGQFPRFSGFSKFPLAFLLGLTAAVVIGGAIFGTLTTQIRAVVNAFDHNEWYAQQDQVWVKILDAVMMLLGTVGVLAYFHFGKKLKPQNAKDHHKRPALFEGLGKIGEVFVGITLGAIFAGVFSSALWALIDRVISIFTWIQRLPGGV